MSRTLSILYVAYPLLAVTDESAGGAEQMLLAVEREMAARGTSHHGGCGTWIARLRNAVADRGTCECARPI